MAKQETKTVVPRSKWRETLSERQTERIAEIIKDGGTVEVLKCLVCGKTLIKDTSVDAGLGDYCDTLVDEGWTPERFKEHRESMSADEIPPGYVSVADVGRKLQSLSIPVSRFVRAFGGDRTLSGKAMDPRLTPVYVKRTRYVDKWAMTKAGLDFINSCRGRGKAALKAPVKKAPVKKAPVKKAPSSKAKKLAATS
jgi:hypothetical protein